MAFHYDSSLATDRDRLRFMLGDTEAETETHKVYLQDDEIEAQITLGAGRIYLAAAYGAEAIAGQLARKYRRSTAAGGPASLSATNDEGQIFDHYIKLAAMFRARDAEEQAALYPGGAFGVIEWICNPFQARERTANESMRIQ